MITPRPRRAGPAVVAVLVALVVAGSAAGCTAAEDPPAPAPATAPALTPDDATRLETALTSPDPAVQRSVLEAGAAQVEGPLFPPGSTLAVDESGWTPGTGIAEGTAEVPATVTGPQPGRWVLLLVYIDGNWTVYGTRPA